jgi:reactive intermediate/imine deaminase
MDEIQTEAAPAPIGPYSQAIRTGDTIYVSGQGPADPDSREVEVVGIREQTDQVLTNAAAVLSAAGASLDDVVETTVYLRDMADYEAVNAVYADHFSPPYPARAAIEVAALPIDVGVEISFRARV